MSTEHQLTAALARADSLEKKLEEAQLPTLEHIQAIYALTSWRARAEAAESELQKIAKAAGHVSLQGAVTICETVETLKYERDNEIKLVGKWLANYELMRTRAIAAESKVKELEAKLVIYDTTRDEVSEIKRKLKGYKSPAEVREMLEPTIKLLLDLITCQPLHSAMKPFLIAGTIEAELTRIEALVKEAAK